LTVRAALLFLINGIRPDDKQIPLLTNYLTLYWTTHHDLLLVMEDVVVGMRRSNQRLIGLLGRY
jgi:hypothetical protein